MTFEHCSREPAVVKQWENFFVMQSAQTLNSLEDIDKRRTPIKSVVFQNLVNRLLAATSGREHEMLGFPYYEKVWEVKHNIQREKRNSTIALAREVEVTANSNDVAITYHNVKQLSGGRKPFDGPIRDVYDRSLIHDDEQLRGERSASPMEKSLIWSSDNNCSRSDAGKGLILLLCIF